MSCPKNMEILFSVDYMLKKVQLKLMFFATLNIHNFVFLFGHVIVTNINFTFTILL